MSEPIPDNEFERLLSLSDLEPDYNNFHNHLGDLINLAAKIADSEISLINLIDSHTQWSVYQLAFDIQ